MIVTMPSLRVRNSTWEGNKDSFKVYKQFFGYQVVEDKLWVVVFDFKVVIDFIFYRFL